MTVKILIDAINSEECRVAKTKNGKLEEFHIESAARESTHGNIYKGIIFRIEPSLQAVFVDYGAERHGFLQKHEIHPDYFLEDDTAERAIQHLVKRGQEVMVQVTKDPSARKGAMLTTYISLPGRYIVLMPGSETRGISRKIEDEDERSRLKGIMSQMTIPEGFGAIVRTAGASSNKTTILSDLKYLLRLWKNIKSSVMREKAPALLYKERNLPLRSIRDYFTPDVGEILIDNPVVYREVKNFINIILPKHANIVKLNKDDTPLFSKFQIEDQISSIFENRVALKSGGSIVIEQTEALVSIDVNSGKSTHEKSIEQTAFQTDLEAAEEIARQLRLRDLGGLIVIDFIDMKDAKHRTQVERGLREHVKEDKARTKVGRISKFGLLEMSRQRIRPSIEFSSFQSCRFCQGKGLIPSTETCGLSFLRKLSLEASKEGVMRVKGIVPVDVADYLLNRKRKDIVDLEIRQEVKIDIETDASMVPGENRIICEP